jgi:TonB family protein
MKKYVIGAAVMAACAIVIIRAQEPPAPIPTDANSLVKAGNAAVGKGRFDQADLYFAQASALPDSPDTGQALLYLGVKAYRSGNAAGAEGFFQRVVAIDGSSPLAGRAFMWMGVMRAQKAGGEAEAESCYQKALALEDPLSLDATDTMRQYARLLRSTNRSLEAETLEQHAKDVQGHWHEGLPKRDLATGVFRMTDGVTAPKLLQKVEPQYTQQARDAKIQGTTVLSVEVGPDGIARNIQVQRSLEAGLDQKAIEAVEQWHFAPGTKDGVTVTVAATIEVNFRLQ